jgi:serine O-acetyltransferase
VKDIEVMVSATVPDWSRERKSFFEWCPAKSLLASIRQYQRWHTPTPLSYFIRAIAVYRHRFWSIVTSSEIPINTRIGGGLMLPHPQGVVIHPTSVIGPNCIIFQQVTLAGSDRGGPILEGHVDIGAGAKVLGHVRLGAHSQVGANAVVLKDVPARATAVGIPARVLERSRNRSQNPLSAVS